MSEVVTITGTPDTGFIVSYVAPDRTDVYTVFAHDQETALAQASEQFARTLPERLD